jgi:hypothetical protein
MKLELEPFINHLRDGRKKKSKLSSCHACVARDCTHAASPLVLRHAYGYAGGRLPVHFCREELHHCPRGSRLQTGRKIDASTQKWSWMNPLLFLPPPLWTMSVLRQSSSRLTRRTLASQR